jgi:hypothetical protein
MSIDNSPELLTAIVESPTELFITVPPLNTQQINIQSIAPSYDSSTKGSNDALSAAITFNSNFSEMPEKLRQNTGAIADEPQAEPQEITTPQSPAIKKPEVAPKEVKEIEDRTPPEEPAGGVLQYDVTYADAIDRAEKALKPENKDASLGQAFDKKIAYILNPKGPARITIFPEDGSGATWLKIGLFFLEGANEYDKVRYQVKKTQGGDILYFFGRETNIWSYSGRTIHGARSSDLIIDENNQTVSTKDWYSDLRTHLGGNLGQPTHRKKKHFIRLEYNNFIRDGYLLDISYQKAAHSSAIPINFTMAIKRAITKNTSIGGL